MKNTISLLILLSLTVGELSAQRPLRIGGNQIDPPANARAVGRGKKEAIATLGEPLEGYYYLLVQLKAIPTKEEREALSVRGIRLMDYVGEQSYYVRIEAEEVSKRVRRTPIVSLMPIRWEWKTSEAIITGEIPPYALRGAEVGAWVSFFEGFSEEWVAARLKSMNISLSKGGISPLLRGFTVWLPREKLIELAKETWVVSVSLVSPPAEIPTPPGRDREVRRFKDFEDELF